jgi:ferritin-like metal-binding protein YciE
MKATLQELLVDELRDLFDAEKQLVKALPKMAKSASDSELENAFREHLEVTKGQVQRLEQVFEMMDMRARSKPCRGMKGLVEEGQEIMGEDFEPGLLDSAILGAARKVEHYEMMGYESAHELARQLRMSDAAQLLQQTLREEMETDKKLAQISKRLTKEASSRPQAGQEEEKSSRGGRGRSSGRSSQAQSRSQSGRSESRSRSETSSRSNSSGRSNGRGRSGGGSSGGARKVTDHEEIRAWAEERGAHPACVRGTGGGEDTGMIRLDFPGYSGSDSLQEISWDDWFEKFDENNLALLIQDRIRGQKSNFNKLVKRETPAHGRTRTARG